MQFKQDLEDSVTSSKSLVGSLPSKDLSTEENIKCIANNIAVEMCLNDKCKQQNIFQCLNQNCKCRQKHYDCQMGKTKRVIKLMDSKILNIQNLQTAINQLIDKKIDQLFNLRLTLLEIVEKDLKFIDLNFLERKFLQLFRGERKVEEFNSFESKKIWQSLNEDFLSQKSVYSTKVCPYFKIFDQSLTKSIQDLKRNISSIKTEKEKEENTKIIQLEIMKQSSICTTEQLAQRFIKIFGKKVTKLSYLFCASQNQFSLQKYFQNFGTVSNTVLICKTNKDKIIGAYTPLVHDYKNNNKYVEDPSGESFIFSLTDQQKFTLKHKLGAILRRTKRDFIVFGNCQLIICDKSNTIDNCCSNVNLQFYHCPAYSKHDKAAYLKFNGNQSYKFSTKEWQVWKVEF